MAHVNSLEVQTAEGVITVTKTSKDRDYVVASVLVRDDDTEAVLVWHLTREAGARYVRSAEANRHMNYRSNLRNGKSAKRIDLREVAVKLTGKDAKAAAPVAPVAAPEAPVITEETAVPEADRLCRCRCGQDVSANSYYRPGHDARHYSRVARLISQGRTEKWDPAELNALVDLLPTQALKLKALAMAHRLDEKAAAKAATKQAKQAK